jgi:hypothetical protein
LAIIPYYRKENHVKQILTANLFANKVCEIKFFEQKPKKDNTNPKEENCPRKNKFLLM